MRPQDSHLRISSPSRSFCATCGRNMTLHKTLDKAQQGEELVIDSVPEDDPALLKYFVEQNLVPGREVDVREAAKTRGVITLDSGAGDIVFSYDVAAKIRVCPR